jgi:hypothetical protein
MPGATGVECSGGVAARTEDGPQAVPARLVGGHDGEGP